MLGSAEERRAVGHGTGVSPVISGYGLQRGHLHKKWWLTVQTELPCLLAWLFTSITGGLVYSFLPSPFSQIVGAFTITCFGGPGQWISRCGQILRQPSITNSGQLAGLLKHQLRPWILDPNYDVISFVDSVWEKTPKLCCSLAAGWITVRGYGYPGMVGECVLFSKMGLWAVWKAMEFLHPLQ